MEEQKALLILNKKASKHSFLNEFVFRNFIYYIPYFITMKKYIFNHYFYNN
ncbi:hypothetical protein VCRA2119O147_520016 [Vibrio crassostreae]|nr:hypothetical protein VCRA2119O145_410021 [Vibrio crassostreae]CAK2114597.1 hypothetical protein VCRA2118O144_430016 [Vibrio crassostreae]CAK2364404.1 hypothetical protein VCRA2117O143_450022 [Vibrio crassostreae]CAK2365649.1 hypothetical protein VCRA2117O142_440022 [Vibrio crassostreae]CAK2368857.1 hypothetical protein VCRA2119O147_520016 [Vibrio crassostreae]